LIVSHIIHPSPDVRVHGINGGRVSFLSLYLIAVRPPVVGTLHASGNTDFENNNEARLYSAGLNQGFIDQTMAWR